MTRIFNLLIASLLIISCADSDKKKIVSSRSDYEGFLKTEETDLSEQRKQVALWKGKIVEEPKGFTFYEKLGSTYHTLFEKTGKINYLHLADSAFAEAEKLTRGKWKVSSLLSLSSLSIKKHDFPSAADYAVAARELTDEKFGALLMQYDAEMELGNYQMAGAILKENKRMDSFDYLVRLSKYKDYEGDLDSAIYYMEQASGLIKSHQKERKIWATANLGDMYGHAGRISDSYQKYLEVLKLEPTYHYALKGIAWVAYSNDGKTVDAIKILEMLRKRSAMPDYHLQLAELYAQEGHEDVSKRLKQQFVLEASRPEYMGMYNKYLIELHAEEDTFEKAIELAQEEISRRQTPATYDWLAWTMHQQGNTQKAIDIYEENVKGKTYEPDVIYHMGVVYAAANMKEGERFLEESLEASYELGPIVTNDIKKRLKG